MMGKSNLLLSCSEPSTVVIDGCPIKLNIKEVLLIIIINKKLKFDDHGNNICKKACQKNFSYILHPSWTLTKEE